MDPITAALNLGSKIIDLMILSIQSQPPEVRAEYAKMQLEDMKKWREFFTGLGIK